jgi:hypothetical protein
LVWGSKFPLSFTLVVSWLSRSACNEVCMIFPCK